MDLLKDGIVVTGANGQLGRALLTKLAADSHPHIRALVRSKRAKETIEAENISPAPEIRIVDYTSPKQMREALTGAQCVIHLVGIIKEMPGTRYVEAHEQTCHALALAASRAGLKRIVYLSILGSTADSPNDCLASKGRAEALLLDDRVPTTVIRVPMVIGGDDPASHSLRKQAQAASIRLIGGGRTLQQPIDARDVVRAVLAACTAQPGHDLSLDAGGPECLSHRNLVLRAARLFDNEPTIGSIPLPLARFAVRCVDKLMPSPPITLAMFDILQHDDRVDSDRFRKTLGIELTPLDTTLSDHVGP
ncbi:MAG: NAD(P)H-binding protein [Proteobacteria bacterium]|nr:NAD(P)H-binding protein [Pseudomonadota bacterium]